MGNTDKIIKYYKPKKFIIDDKKIKNRQKSSLYSYMILF